jgi:hypothetical protein
MVAVEPIHASMKRTLLHLASLYPGASLGLVVPVRRDHERPLHSLAISRTDFTLTKAIQRHMAGRGAAADYEHMVLAGAPLSALTPQFPEWSALFQEHVELVTRPRRIAHVMLVESDPAAAAPLRALGQGIQARNPALRVEMLLMRDGALEALAA